VWRATLLRRGADSLILQVIKGGIASGSGARGGRPGFCFLGRQAETPNQDSMTMSLDPMSKTPEMVEPFSVKVIGGTFHIREVMVGNGGELSAVESLIRETPEDQWFVMTSEDSGEPMDSLAMIDENLEFQIFARGNLEQG